MIRWTLTFLVIVLIAAVFGFTGIMPDSQDWIARVVFYIFFVFLIISFIIGTLRRSD